MYSRASRNSFQAASAEKIADRGEARPEQRKREAAEQLAVARPVDPRRLEQLLGQRVEVHLEQVHRERQAHRRVGQDQREPRVRDAHQREHARLGDEVALERQDQAQREQAQDEAAAAEPVAAERERGGGAEHQDQRHGHDRHDRRVDRVLPEVADLPGLHPAAEVDRLGQRERGREDVRVRLERRHHHPDHREEEREREQEQRGAHEEPREAAGGAHPARSPAPRPSGWRMAGAASGASAASSSVSAAGRGRRRAIREYASPTPSTMTVSTTAIAEP